MSQPNGKVAWLVALQTWGNRPSLAGSHAALFCRVLGSLHRRVDFRLHAFVVLPDRARLIVASSDGEERSVIALVHRLRSRFGRELRDKARWPGRVFRDEIPMLPIAGREALERRAEFLHRLPVLMGLVAEPRDWRWSSVRGWEGGGRPPAPVDRPGPGRPGEGSAPSQVPVPQRTTSFSG
jgi:hypothetical protein